MSNIDKHAVQAVADLKAGYTLSHADVAILNELARIALASLEAEPVAWLLSGGGAKNNVSFDSGNAYADPLREVTPLYTAHPAPVSVPETLPCPVLLEPGMRFGKGVRTQTMLDALQRRSEYFAELEAMTTEQRTERDAGIKEFAAMLQGKAELVTAHPELTVWYGSMPETNGKTNWTAMLHRKGHHPWEGITIDRSEYPERVRYEADRMRHLIGELTDEPDILAYDADAHSGYAEPVSQRDELPLDYLQGQKDGLEWAAQLAEANHPHTGDWLYDDPVELAKAIRKGPDMPELKSVPADADDNFYSWFCREWEQNYQPNRYSLSAKKHLGAIAESAWFACRAAMLQGADGNSPVISDGWVACSERIPEIGTEIFYFCQGDGLRDCGIVSSSNFSGKGDAQLYVHAEGYDLRLGVDITHWMPLPAAPQQE